MNYRNVGSMRIDYAREIRYIDNFVENLVYVLEDAQVSGKVVRVFRGPASVAVTVRIAPTHGIPLKKSIGEARKVTEQLQVLTDAQFVRVTSGQGTVTYEIPSMTHVTPGLDFMKPYVRPRMVVLGFNAMNGRPYYVDVNEEPNIAWVGLPGSGKSESMISALWAAVMSGNSRAYPSFVIMTRKPKKWAMFGYTPGCMGVYEDPVEMGAIMRQIAENVSDDDDSPLIFIMDDVQALLKMDRSFADYLSIMTSAGRGQHLYVWLGTQLMGSKGGAGGFDVENMISMRIVSKVASAQMAYFAAGSTMSGAMELTGKPGDFVALNRRNDVVRLATPYVTTTCADLLPRINTPVDTNVDWYQRFYNALKSTKQVAEQTEANVAAVQEIKQSRKRLSKDEQLLLCQDNIADLRESGILTTEDYRRVVAVMDQGVSKRTIIEYFLNSYNGRTKKAFDEMMQGAMAA